MYLHQNTHTRIHREREAYPLSTLVAGPPSASGTLLDGDLGPLGMLPHASLVSSVTVSLIGVLHDTQLTLTARLGRQILDMRSAEYSVTMYKAVWSAAVQLKHY